MPFEIAGPGLPPIEVPDQDHMGPAMRALNERQRRFVCALSIYGGDQGRAYSWAGYQTTNDNSARAAASRLATTDAVKAAIREEAQRRLDYSALLAVSTMVELAGPENTDKKVRKAAAEALMDRTGFHSKSEHHVVVEDRRTLDELRNFIEGKLAAKGISIEQFKQITSKPKAEVVDAEFTEVEDGSDGLEDML